tara:strand:+ start:5667 stop:8180 length:2514 start_codon:yes stop_codon:yes gene_type:complete
MNKKELAKEIFNHPMMKILRESKGVDDKALIKILAEEINEQYLLDEAPKNTLSNKLTKMLADAFKELGKAKSDPEALTAAVNDTVSNFINQIRDEKKLPNLFSTWETWSDKRKQNMIAAGQKYNPKVEPRIKSALAKYAEDGQIDAGEAEKAAAVILEPIAAQLEDDNELQAPDVKPEEATKILNQFLDIVAQILKPAEQLQEQEVKDKEFGKSIMAFLEAAEVNPEQVEQIKTKLGEVELDLRVVDQALAAEGAVEKALEGLKQRLEAPTEPEETPAQPEETAAEATPENEDLEELPKAELQRKMLAQSIEPVDKFFDETDGFLKQLLLSKQGELLRDMIVGLGKIERGDLGEDLALTDIIVVPDEPDPQPETKSDEGETTSEIPEQIDLQEQEEPQVSANAKARRMVKNEVAAIRDLLKDVVAVAKRYEQNATRTNIDSRFDGTKLKSVFDEKLEATQRQIARLVAIIGKVMEEAMADKPAEQLQEQDAQTRQEKIKLVQDTYRDLMRLYKNSFQVQAGEEFDFAKTQQAARNMINVVDDSGIVAFYPRITKFDAASGQVITLGQAYEEMTKLVKKLAKTTADIFLNIRDGEIEVNNMQRAILDLQDISSAIENYYGIKSMIRAKDVAKIDPDQLESFGYELSPGEEIDMPIDPGKDEPKPTADVEIEDNQPMTSNEFIEKYLNNTRNYNILLTQSKPVDVMRLVDFLRFLKFENDNMTVVEQLNPSIQGKNAATIIEPLMKNDLLKKTLKRMNITKERRNQLFKTLEKHHKVVKDIIKNLGIELSKPQKTTEPDPGDDFFAYVDQAFARREAGKKKQEQLINKLIPIVESILKD